MHPNLNTDSPEQLNRTCDNCGKPFKTRRSYILKARVRGCTPPRFCSRLCYSAQKPAPKTKHNTTPPEVRFWAKVKKSNGCWLWTGGTFKKSGYGRLQVRMKAMVASRYSYILHNGPIPDDLMVCHTCDNRLCVRPDHLFLGSGKDNQQDMVQKGRGRFGERSGQAKLTDAQVIEIRQRYKRGGISQEKLGKEYGVNQTNIGFIVRGVRWTHLPV